MVYNIYRDKGKGKREGNGTALVKKYFSTVNRRQQRSTLAHPFPKSLPYELVKSKNKLTKSLLDKTEKVWYNNYREKGKNPKTLKVI